MPRIDQIFAQRRRQQERSYRRTGIWTSVVLHVVLLVSAFVGPLLFARREPPPQFVDVIVVPPPSVESRPRPQPQPQKEPEPPRPQPEPPKPEPEPDVPVLPAEEPKEAEPEPPPPQPSSEPEEDTSEEPPLDPPDTGISAERSIKYDNPDFTYGYYTNRMVEAIRRQWVRPPVGSDVEMIVHFFIEKNGRVRDLEVVTESGYRSYDLAAMRAVQSARLPPLPRSYRRDELGVTLVFR